MRIFTPHSAFPPRPRIRFPYASSHRPQHPGPVRSRTMDETSDTSATPSLLFPERREEAYRAMADESPDALLVHSGRHFVYANAPALKLVGAADIAQLSAIDPVDI